ncbi:NAD(P)H-hydrate epimerase [Achromobacter denitrificans]|uniref:NAD(P)H-hydrate epimerase n=1 Tax=Achromobacter denitrificans TaxID=32002 RepID=UPI000F4D6DC5|nr:NAD(P)H-hydrate epimerase [Achromobacter denitrificans]MBV2161823.1 NAD(P)H-hydrate epimerase [Achromobacter denitrificans]MDX3879988.1 NAD(P)H-hydrate epimerase [Achromobacter sp.]QCS61488.1 NAD(P)H-hydrate epimerase [Achromobacter denitrificans]WFC66791.1 NAD(P)H-hydrate epimerase [Achromobacter denitrificans]
MQPRYSVAQIRDAERQALAGGRRLMPLAGAAAARFVAARIPPGTPVLALAGPGNNGGDALEAATLLRAMGHDVRVLLPSGPQGLPADAARAHAGWVAAGGATLSALEPGYRPGLVIDGLFGIGLNRPLSADWQALVDTVNAWGLPVLALDVPSGLDADTGAALGRPIQARWTLSFIARARGLDQSGAAAGAIGESHLDTLGVTMPAGAGGA